MKTLADLGEKAVVASLIGSIRSTAAVGPGDDAAAVDIGPQYLVATSDITSRLSHMPKGMSYWQTGWYVAAVNFSDVAAMGARPIGILASFVLPRSMPVDDFLSIMKGVQDCALSVGAEVLGGDTKEGDDVAISGCALGLVDKDKVLLRSEAGEGDLLAVTGPMGLSAAGYFAITQGIDAPRALKALLEPQPRTREGMVLSSSGAVTSCMDITDGLAFTISEIGKRSGVSFEVDWGRIPIDPETLEVAKRTGESVEELAMYYGGDYELLFTFRPEAEEQLRASLGERFHIIGKAVGKENILIRDGGVVPIENRGWEHFRM